MLLPLVSRRFQVLFHSGPPVLFTFPSRYYTLSVTDRYLGLDDGPPRFPQGFTCPVVLGCLTLRAIYFAYRTFTVYGRPFHAVLLYMTFVTQRACCNTLTQGPTTPYMQRLQAYTCMVWALPVSLATTPRIVFTFFSYGYLDVSVPCVRLICLCIQHMIPGHNPRWVSPFGYPRIKAC